MKKIIATTVSALIVLGLQSQTVDEALRYSRYNYLGSTAKSTAMAGALGAIGGDFSSLAINPAGIGIYRSGEFSITPSIYNANSESLYLGSYEYGHKTKFNIGNYGLIIPIEAEGNAESYGFEMFQIGLGVNRIENFHNDIRLQGYNDKNSITTGWVDHLNNANPTFIFDNDGNPILNGLDTYSTALAWNTWLIDWATDEQGNPYLFSDMYGGGVDQFVRLSSYGSMNEFDISGGFNWNDMIFLGATIGIPYFDYEESYVIREQDATAEGHPYFSTMDYRTALRTSGSGVNFKIGTIIKPVQFLRLGFAYHTPSLLNLTDDYEASMETHIDLSGNYQYERFNDIAYSYYEYSLVTPSRFIASLGLVIGNFATISADYEYADYSKTRYISDDPWAFDEVNDMIKDNLTASSCIRVGAELSYNIFKLRGGYAYNTSPYANADYTANSPVDGSIHTFSLGAGLRFRSFYMDFGFANSSDQLIINPYSNNYASYVQPAETDCWSRQYQLTLGFRF